MSTFGCFGENQQECAFSHCLSKFRDEFGGSTTITTTTAKPTENTESINPISPEGVADSFLGSNLPVFIGSGCGIFVVVCLTAILCLCRARNREKEKRRVIEEDYRVVATTLTNVTDSDGTTYEELCIDNPHYNRHGDVQLPCKKDRKRLPGVSNAVTDTFKRWISVDANQATANTSKALMQASSKPLPPIPGTSKQTASLERNKELASTKLSKSIDEYTEVGSEVKRRSNIYNPLDREKLDAMRESHGTYAMLRESTMFENVRPPIGLPAGEYFTLEKVDDQKKQVQEIEPGEYMVLAKEENEGKVVENTESDKLLDTEMVAIGGDEPEIKPYAERCLIEDEGDSGICENGGNKNDYYILQKESDSSDYIEPIEGEKHAYMQVLPETTHL